jgi:hypothetical protein
LYVKKQELGQIESIISKEGQLVLKFNLKTDITPRVQILSLYVKTQKVGQVISKNIKSSSTADITADIFQVCTYKNNVKLDQTI